MRFRLFNTTIVRSSLTLIATAMLGSSLVGCAAQKTLSGAAQYGQVQQINKLIADGQSVEQKDPKTGFTPLHEAAWNGQPDAAEALIAHGADVNARAMDGATPLLTAVVAYQYDAAKTLLDHGANVNAGNSDGWSPIHYAIYNRDLPMVELLLKYHADPNAVTAKGMTPYTVALYYVCGESIVNTITEAGGR